MGDNHEILDMLKQIESNSRRQARIGKIMCICALVTAVCCGAAFVLILNLLPQVDTVMTQMQAVLGNLELTATQLAAMDLDQTMDKLNSIDIEMLNQAIRDLAAVVEPLAKFFSAFN